jgi:hypothetical protein
LTSEAWVEQHRLEMFLEKVVMGKVEMVNRDKKVREKWLRYHYGNPVVLKPVKFVEEWPIDGEKERRVFTRISWS